MMKSGEITIIVDSVETALKFYTEILPFDIVDMQLSTEDTNILASASLKKGKCLVHFRRPLIEEYAEFSFIKRCQSRCIELCIEIKTELKKIAMRCEKKDVKVVRVATQTQGLEELAIKDPFGIKITFIQNTISTSSPKHTSSHSEIAGFHINPTDLARFKEQDETGLDNLIAHLKNFDISRRAAKKYAKMLFKSLTN